MRKFTRLLAILVFALISANGSRAAVIEVGDLNIIMDAGNPSDGLAYLDLSVSVGLTLANALANAQATYSNARVATPAEWDDLFAAAGISYTGSDTASDAFAVGASPTISSGFDYDAGALAAQLCGSFSNCTRFYSDPDGSGDIGTTRDYLWLNSSDARIINSPITVPHADVGWMLVTPVPLPAAGYLFITALVGLFGMKRLARRR